MLSDIFNPWLLFSHKVDYKIGLCVQERGKKRKLDKRIEISAIVIDECVREM